MTNENIRNVAIIAHVDHGKTSLVNWQENPTNATSVFSPTTVKIYVPNQATKDALMGNQYWKTLGESRIIVDESLLAM